MDHLDRLAIPIPDCPIDESPGKQMTDEEQYRATFQRLKDHVPERSSSKILFDKYWNGVKTPDDIAAEKRDQRCLDEAALERIAAEQRHASKLERLRTRVSTVARNITSMAFPEFWNEMAEDVHDLAVEKGWWETDRNDGEIVALIHSELSEALEALRNDNPPSGKIPSFSSVEEELADAVIRIMDYAAIRKLRVGEAIVAKHTFNMTRPYKHGKKF